MGYATTVQILNDHWHDMKRQPERLVDMIDALMDRGGAGWGNGVQVMPTDHVDVPRLYFSQRNSITELSPYNRDTLGLGERMPDYVRGMIRDAEWLLKELKKELDKAENPGKLKT